MYSLRKLSLGLAVGVVFVLGCQPVQRTDVVAVQPAPSIPDEAMQERQWAPMLAYYANGSTIANSTGFLYEPVDNLPWWGQLTLEPAMFLGQVPLLPFTLLLQPGDVTYSGVETPRTYTAAPPLPPRPWAVALPPAQGAQVPVAIPEPAAPAPLEPQTAPAMEPTPSPAPSMEPNAEPAVVPATEPMPTPSTEPVLIPSTQP